MTLPANLHRSEIGKVMDNLDILFHIFSKLEDAVLFQLYLIGFREELSKLLFDNLFWKERVKNSAQATLKLEGELGDRVVWKRVYYALEKSKEVIPEQGMLPFLVFDKKEIGTHYFYGLDYLPSLLVLLQIYPEPSWAQYREKTMCVWKYSSDVEVIRYLVSRGLLPLGHEDEYLVYGLLQYAVGGKHWMLQPLLAMIEDGNRREITARHIVMHSISSKDMVTIKMGVELARLSTSDSPSYRSEILGHVGKHGDGECTSFFLDLYRVTLGATYEDMADRAIDYDNSSGLQVLLERANYTFEQKQELFYRVCGSLFARGSILRMLDELDPTIKGKKTYGQLLNHAIKTDDSELVKYLLTKVSPATNSNQAVKTAAKKSNMQILNLLLSDERIDPDTAIKDVMNCQKGISAYALRELVRHPRVRVERR